MIARAIRYAGPSAAVRTLFGELLRSGDYEMLLNAADISELRDALGTTRYAAALRTREKSFAYGLQQDWIARTEKVANLQPANARELCLAYLAKVEVEALKTLLRGIARGVERRRILPMLPALPAGSSLPLNALLATTSLEQAAQALEHTRYADALKEAGAHGGEARGDAVLRVETAMEKQFFDSLAAACRDFSGSERAIVNCLIGALADAFNVLAAQRLRKTFRLTPEAASVHLVAFGLRLGANERRALCEWTGDGMPPVWFGAIPAAGGLRVSLLRALCREVTKPLFTVPFHAGLAIAYIVLIELELTDLLAIHEAKQWGVERAAIADALIRFHGPALIGGSGV
jgi:vacuolar-type H+-ATPase subunit C/Vma6